MLAANYSTLRSNLKEYCDKVCDADETLIITRKENRNVVMMSLEKYTQLEKQIRNAEYLAKLALAKEQVKEGRVVVKTMDELEAMAE